MKIAHLAGTMFEILILFINVAICLIAGTSFSKNEANLYNDYYLVPANNINFNGDLKVRVRVSKGEDIIAMFELL